MYFYVNGYSYTVYKRKDDSLFYKNREGKRKNINPSDKRLVKTPIRCSKTKSKKSCKTPCKWSKKSCKSKNRKPRSKKTRSRTQKLLIK